MSDLADCIAAALAEAGYPNAHVVRLEGGGATVISSLDEPDRIVPGDVILRAFEVCRGSQR